MKVSYIEGRGYIAECELPDCYAIYEGDTLEELNLLVSRSMNNECVTFCNTKLGSDINNYCKECILIHLKLLAQIHEFPTD